VCLAEKRIAGEVEIDLASRSPALREVDLEAPGLTIDGVWSGERPLPFRTVDGRLLVTLDPPARQGETRTLRVRYAGSPQTGMRFGADQVFTAFNTSAWLPSKSDPGDKATLTLRLTLPAGYEVAASGHPVSRETLADGRVRHVWREDRPHAAYLFGFTAARFQEASAKEGPVALRFLSSGLTPAQLATIFGKTGEMLRFFEERSGVPFPAGKYTQVLLPEGPAQEMAEMSLMDEDYGRSVLDDPREDSLMAHELSHQWWGNLLTCTDWSDFWLNEGTATFMAAAWKEHAWGPDEYQRAMLISRRRYAQAVADGKDRLLVFTGWEKADDMGGAVTYSKGALVLHLLRRELGDAAFWEGLRLYTRTAAAAGGSVRTRALQKGMETASGRDLGWFFDQWAYGLQPALTARHRFENGAILVDLEQKTEKPWRIGLRIAVETDRERVSRRIELTKEKETFRIPILGTPLSVRLDDGAWLPLPVEHERPWPMLLHQMRHEPDAAGRADAMLALVKLCGGTAKPESCTGIQDLLRERATEDPARIIRQLAEQALEAAKTNTPPR
jgi:aminopeptidase N